MISYLILVNKLHHVSLIIVQVKKIIQVIKDVTAHSLQDHLENKYYLLFSHFTLINSSTPIMVNQECIIAHCLELIRILKVLLTNSTLRKVLSKHLTMGQILIEHCVLTHMNPIGIVKIISLLLIAKQVLQCIFNLAACECNSKIIVICVSVCLMGIIGIEACDTIKLQSRTNCFFLKWS